MTIKDNHITTIILEMNMKAILFNQVYKYLMIICLITIQLRDNP